MADRWKGRSEKDEGKCRDFDKGNVADRDGKREQVGDGESYGWG